MHANFVFQAVLPRSKCLNFGAQDNKTATVSIFSPSICMKCWDQMPWYWFFECWVSASFFTLLFHFIKRFFSSSLLSVIRVMSSAFLRLLIFLLAIWIPACASYSLAFYMIYSEYKLNQQGDNIQPWYTPIWIWNQPLVPGPVLTVVSWPADRFLRRQVRWSGIPTSLGIFHSCCDPHSQRLWHTQ